MIDYGAQRHTDETLSEIDVMRYLLRLVLLLPLLMLFTAACSPEEEPVYLVRLQVDNTERVYQHTEPITIDQFLEEAGIELNTLDRVYPEPWTQIYDEMRITVTRVEEREYCEEVDLPFREQIRLAEGLQPGEERIGQRGRAGKEQICYRVRVENGVEQDPVETRRVQVLDPVNQVIFVGPTRQLDPVPIEGTLAYINNKNAWIIRGNSGRKRLLLGSADIDSRVFTLSPDGRQLLFARETADEATFNQLWLIPDTIVNDPEPVALIPQDVLYADWVPNSPETISYSTAESRPTPPGWTAFNDLWLMTIDPATGQQIRIEQVLEQSSGGTYGWWGTNYVWSPDGQRLAWIRADSVGLVDLENGVLGEPLLEYSELNPLQDWSWRTTVSWSPDSQLIAATVHGPPFGDEPAVTSPIFNIAVASVAGAYSTEIVDRAGIWSTPRFSPILSDPDSEFPQGYIAYLQARQWDTSINGEYDLIVADRDGSNARAIFPEAGQPGLSAEYFLQDFTWSPDGRQIALIYLGNLWIIDVESGQAFQITQDGGASKPVWAP
ncbi:MAG: DPP IV N-terminal domain-containing protein [Chloroflexota bacterium]